MSLVNVCPKCESDQVRWHDRNAGIWICRYRHVFHFALFKTVQADKRGDKVENDHLVDSLRYAAENTWNTTTWSVSAAVNALSRALDLKTYYKVMPNFEELLRREK